MTLRDDWDEGGGEGEVGEETAQAMLASVEEMLEGYEWASGELFATGRGTTDQIQARLLNELTALEKVSHRGVVFVLFTENPDITCRPISTRS